MNDDPSPKAFVNLHMTIHWGFPQEKATKAISRPSLWKTLGQALECLGKNQYLLNDQFN